MGNNVEKPVRCPHCGKLMVWSTEKGNWACENCGYEGLEEERFEDYAMPPRKEG